MMRPVGPSCREGPWCLGPPGNFWSSKEQRTLSLIGKRDVLAVLDGQPIFLSPHSGKPPNRVEFWDGLHAPRAKIAIFRILRPFFTPYCGLYVLHRTGIVPRKLRENDGLTLLGVFSDVITVGAIWPLLAAIWPLLATFGHIWPHLAAIWPLLAAFGHFFPALGKLGSFASPDPPRHGTQCQ